MSPRYALLTGTSMARSHATPSHASNATNEFGSIVTTVSPGCTPRRRRSASDQVR